jgi:hypothetical protein
VVTPALNYSGTLTVPVTVRDAGNAVSAVFNASVVVTAVDDPPVITAQIALSTPEDIAITLLPANFTITDVDNTPPFTLTVNSGSNYTFAGTVVTPAGNFSGTLTVPVTAKDAGNAVSAVFNATVTVVAVNDAPVLAAVEPNPLSYNEGSGAVQITSTISVADTDNVNLQKATISITSGYQSAEDILACPAITGITIVWSAGILTLTGNVPKATFQTALRSVTYKNTSLNPVTEMRIITFRVNDGTLNSIDITRTITIGSVDNAPVLSSLETTVLSYTENEAAKDITNTILLTDSDDANMVSATVSISSNYQSAEDVLAFTNTDEITGTWNSISGILTLSGISSSSNYRISLRNVSYRNTSDNPAVSSRTISFLAFDGELYSNVVSRAISIIAVNDPPVATNVIISRTNDRIGTLHTGTFTYTDPETGALSPGTPVYKWYRKLPNRTVVWIDSVSAITYTPVLKDGGDSICFEVTPVDNLGLAGTAVKSAYNYINAVPVASNVHIYAPILKVNNTVYGRYTYSDKENNLTSIPAYQWYRSATATGTGTLIASAADSAYKLTVSDDNKYIRCVITPTAKTGSTPGTAASSGWIGPVGSNVPTAVISGVDTICSNGPKAKITVALTGESSWTIRYRRSYSGKTEEKTIQFIKNTPYIFDAPGNGTYTLLSVSDTNYSSGTVSGSAVISYYPVATAKLTGSVEICQGISAPIPLAVDFTGTAPWTFILQRSNMDNTFPNVTQDPFNFTVSQMGTYRIISLYDKYCTGDTVAGYGTAVLSYISTPLATLSGKDTTCPGDTAVLQVKLEGTGPFSITYLRNGADAKTIRNITQQKYMLKVVGDGTYTLSVVSDKIRSGCVSGSGIVTIRAIPAATIAGTGNTCQYGTTNLKITLAGTPPWSFSYRRNSEAPAVVSPVASSPKYIPVSKAGTYTLVNVSDKYCQGTVSGSALISVIPAPAVTITGLKPAYSVQTLLVPIFGNPSGGTFFPTMIEIQDTMYFSPRYAGTGVHTIIYSYRDPKTGCTGYDTTSVTVLAANADIIFPDNDTRKFFCFYDSSFTIAGHNTANVIGTFSISGGIGLVDHGDNTATISPSELNGGTYSVTYRYYSGASLDVSESFEVESIGNIRIFGFEESSYCQSPVPIKLNGNMPGGVFSGNAVFSNQGAGYFFQSDLTVPGPDTVFYTFTSSRGCSRQTFKSLDIYDTPLIHFTVEDSCIYNGTADSTAFINLTSSFDPIREWYWYFDDVNSGEKNSSTLKNPKHQYSEARRRSVFLRATTTNSCIGSGEINLFFEAKPAADFTWATECFQSGQAISLYNQSHTNKSEITESKWKIFFDETSDSLFTRDAEYVFNAPDDYAIELTVNTGYGCRDSIRKILHLRPTYALTEGASYFEGFESGTAGWISSSDTIGVNSWNLGKPDEAFGSSEAHTKAWYTHVTKEWPPLEQSYVTSPCFNFSGINKPMIKFDLRRLFKENRDGANLQYTADSGKHWYMIGKPNEGISWYNSSDIEGKPGGSIIGWSNVQDKEWSEARHSLDLQKGKYNVQFRFTYGSDGTAQGTNGLAFDNVWIGERKKMALIEHFTSTCNMASRSADSTLNALANSNPLDIIDIQYHTSFFGTDPFNESNPVDPRTRASLYNLSTAPVSILNGRTTGKYLYNYLDKPLDTTMIKNQALTDPIFSIDLHTTALENSIIAVADIRPLKEVPDLWVTLHMAIIERMVTGVTGANGDTLFESVLKIMLPDTSFSGDWYPGIDIKSISRTWNFNNVSNKDEIRVIAFIQDENTREVYQAAIDQYDLHTGLHKEIRIPEDPAGISFVLFPNPASHEVFIGFDEALNKKAKADLYDMNGRLVLSSELYPGNKLFRISLDDCTEGLFVIRITSENQFIGLKKIILSR